MAQPPTDAYVVRNVVVDITADNAVNARNQAFVQAQGKAFGQLLQQLEQPAGRPPPDEATLGRMVRDFELASEHMASNRYRGNFTVHFDPAQVDAFLGTPPATAAPPTPPAIASPAPSMPPKTQHHQVTLVIPFDTLVEWRQIQAKLQQTKQISDITIFAMQYKQAEVRALLLAPLPDVQARLRPLGYALEAQGADRYLLRRGA